MKVAIIGAGISGLSCAYWLSRQHQVCVYESAAKVGGHTATVDVDLAGQSYAIDTGFIVFNDWTYPQFNQLIDELGVEFEPTQMSFSVSDRVKNFEYSGTNLNSLLAQRSNLLKRSFWAMVSEIRRFNKQARQDFTNNEIDPDMTMGDYLDHGHYDEIFRHYYILPMASAIWSMPRKTINSFQARFFIRFFHHHGLLNITNRPQWQVISGGSREYLGPLTAPYAKQIRTNCVVTAIERSAMQVRVKTKHDSENYDAVVFACHSDQALNILGAAASEAEKQVLGNIKYCASDVVLHTDTTMLPSKRRAWASWNYLLTGRDNDVPLVTYNMNILQRLKSDTTFCVSLNAGDNIDPDKIIRKFSYAHPQLNADSMHAQQRWQQVSGTNRTWYCGAYWGNGFHEDGVASARRVIESIEEQTCQSTYSTAA